MCIRANTQPNRPIINRGSVALACCSWSTEEVQHLLHELKQSTDDGLNKAKTSSNRVLMMGQHQGKDKAKETLSFTSKIQFPGVVIHQK